jgi:hypothetical protein
MQRSQCRTDGAAPLSTVAKHCERVNIVPIDACDLALSSNRSTAQQETFNAQ